MVTFTPILLHFALKVFHIFFTQKKNIYTILKYIIDNIYKCKFLYLENGAELAQIKLYFEFKLRSVLLTKTQYTI